LSLNRWQLKMY